MMKGCFTVIVLSLLLISSSAFSDTPLIRTTISDSSRVTFIAQTPLEWGRVEHGSLDFIRFENTAVTDSVGFPELPIISCLIAMPDSVSPELEFAWAGMREQKSNPVYPAPAHVLSTEFTAAIVDSFVQDSTAYMSSSFWPSEMARVIGETRLCGQRLIQVQLFPARYRASDSTLVTVSSISASLSFDSSEAVWNTTGLGAFQNLIDDSPIIGYHQVPLTYAPVPAYWPEVDPYNGPSRMPDYVIICASGLYDQCEDAVDDLAEHRVSLNGFDVALVTTDDILADFGGSGQLVITDSTIRQFTEHMWENWTQTSGKKPSYLLLIGDHEDNTYYDEPWFLPTHEYEVLGSGSPLIGNDEWYAYFNQASSVNSAFPDMFVGRLSVKNGGVEATDTLSTLIYNLIDLEDPIVAQPITDNRRSILRLTGTGDVTDTYVETYTDWAPERKWTYDFTEWLDFDFRSSYCGDGRNFSSSDGSTLSSEDYLNICVIELKTGAGVAYYSDHGDFHMFSAGLEWCPSYYVAGDNTKGAKDSTFNNYQVENQLTSTYQYYSAPFVLLLCCMAGTYNHTISVHENRESCEYFCAYDMEGYNYDFRSDCLAEMLLKNTAVQVAGVFGASQVAWSIAVEKYGTGILEAIYARGQGRLGNAIASARNQYASSFLLTSGQGARELGQFNLLGDPALNISDRVRYPNHCDLSVYPGEITVSLYPEQTSNSLELPIEFIVRNNGKQESDECDVKLTLRNGSNVDTEYFTCDEIATGESETFQYTWDCPTWFNPPMDLTISVEVDVNDECTDSWRGNNSGTSVQSFNDTYPVKGGWIIGVDELISTTPVLANIDNDLDLEIIVLTGNSLTALDEDGTEKWIASDEDFLGSNQILASDLESDGSSEFLVAYDGGIKVISSSGSVLDEVQVASTDFVVGDMSRLGSGLELCIALAEECYLYTWDSANDEFDYLTVKDFNFNPARYAQSLACADLGGTAFEDIVYCTAKLDPLNAFRGMLVYNWDGSSPLFDDTWTGDGGAVYPAAGTLAGTRVVGYPFGSYEYQRDDPAAVITPSTSSEVDCQVGTCNADKLNYAVFADWDPNTGGADTFILPSEMQVMAWEADGDAFGSWPSDEFQGTVIGSQVSPTSLGNIDNSTYSEVVFSTLLNETCTILAFDWEVEHPSSLDFPITLPDDVTSFGGFAIADIDRDGTVEIVFGTSDGKLHCWELGSCSTGYAPWPQFQHDDGRTGVLE